MTPQRKTRSDIFSRTYAYLGCLDSASDYGSFQDWFFFNFAADFEQKTKNLEREGFDGVFDSDTPYSEILAAVSRSVDLIMDGSGWTGLRYSPSNQALVMSHPKFGEMKVDQLSDGQRNMIAMVGDIAYRCVRLNPHLAALAPSETEGIVLIDEIDMHLHPQWQQLVAGSLHGAFPRIQFILTTHSPQVISTLPAESIRILGQSDGHQWVDVPRQQTKGVSSTSVLSAIFGTDPTPRVPESELLSKYLARIQLGTHESSEGRALRDALVQHFGPDHPTIRKTDRMIRLEEFKRRLPSPTTQSEG